MEAYKPCSSTETKISVDLSKPVLMNTEYIINQDHIVSICRKLPQNWPTPNYFNKHIQITRHQKQIGTKSGEVSIKASIIFFSISCSSIHAQVFRRKSLFFSSLFSSPSQPCTDSPSLHGWHSSFSIPRGGSLSLSNVCLWISSYWNNPQVGQSMVIQITASFWEAPDAGTCRHWRRIIVPSLFAEQLLLYYRGSNTPIDKSDLWLHLFTQSLPGELWHCPSSASPRRQFENSLHFDETGSR